jgi:hypothetical protein
MAERSRLEDIQGSLCICHPERSGWFAKRSSYAVEGPLASRRYQRPSEEFPPSFEFALDAVAGLNQSFLGTLTP